MRTRASCFIGVSKHLETIKALRPSAFICFSVFGYPDKTLALVLEIVHASLLQIKECKNRWLKATLEIVDWQ